MDIFEAILTRRSIRKYKTGSISEEMIKDLLCAAMSAPSACNKQPWHFVIMDDRSILQKIPLFHPHAKMISQAALGILVCGDEQQAHDEGYVQQDCSAAIQNILLAAHGKGLGSVWVGIYPRKERMEGMRALLNIPDHILPFGLISIGYPDEAAHEVDRYSEAKVHRNSW